MSEVYLSRIVCGAACDKVRIFVTTNLERLRRPSFLFREIARIGKERKKDGGGKREGDRDGKIDRLRERGERERRVREGNGGGWCSRSVYERREGRSSGRGRKLRLPSLFERARVCRARTNTAFRLY